MRRKPYGSIGIVIPAYNEHKHIAQTVAAVLEIPWVRRVVVVDDGSTDSTSKKAKSAGAFVRKLKINSGKGAALLHGLPLIKDCPYVLMLDADISDHILDFTKLLPPLINGETDITIARFTKKGSGSGFGIVKNIARLGVKWLSGADIGSVLSGQRAMKRKVVAEIKSLDYGYGLETGMTIDLARSGFRFAEVDVRMKHRDMGGNLTGFIHRGRQFVHIARAILKRAWYTND